MTYDQAVNALYDAECTLRILAQAIDGEQISGVPVSKIGAGRIIEIVANQIGDTITPFELAQRRLGDDRPGRSDTAPA